MLSILIPTFNYNIVPLVTELHRQSMEQMIDFEIIVMEDGSTLYLEENKIVGDLIYCQYIVLPLNMGRSAIRNKLADISKYKFLLFLDCDSDISSKYFINRYLSFCIEECVIMGGRIYNENNLDPTRSLIKTYGIKRERYNGSEMGKNKHKMFMTPNFLISKSIFNKVRFDETIIGYGHEDSIFGIELEQMKIDFIMIDNPVIHKGLEDNETYIKKTEYSLENLYRIYLTNKYPTLATKSKVLSVFIKIKRFKFHHIIRYLYQLTKPILIKNLKSQHPSLMLFDFYKLGHLCSISISK